MISFKNNLCHWILRCFFVHEGEKCEIKSTKMIVRESTVKTTSIIAIVILIGLFSLAILSDIHSFYIKKHKPKKEPKPNQRRSKDVYICVILNQAETWKVS